MPLAVFPALLCSCPAVVGLLQKLFARLFCSMESFYSSVWKHIEPSSWIPQRENGIGFGKLLKRLPLYILGPFLCVLPLCLHISATPSSKPICEWLLNRTMRLEPRFIRCRSKWFGCQVSPSADKRKRTARSTGSVLNVCTVTRWPHWTERNGNTFDLINWIFRCHWGQSRYFILVLGATSFAAYQCLCMCVSVVSWNLETKWLFARSCHLTNRYCSPSLCKDKCSHLISSYVRTTYG